MEFNLLTHIRDNDNTRVVWLFNIGIEKYWNGEVFTVKNTGDDIIVNHMEEMNLLLTRSQDILILRSKPDKEFLEYMESLGCEIPTIITPTIEDENRGISELVAEDDSLIQAIQDELKDTKDAIFVPYGVSTVEEKIAYKLGLTLFGSSHDINKAVNNKVFSREFAINHDFRVAEGQICEGYDELVKVAEDYLIRYGKIIIKEPCGASGKGLWVVDSTAKLKSSLLIIKRFFKEQLEGQWLVEEWCSKQADLNYQVYVGIDGTVEVFSIKEQKVNGTVYTGSVIPPGFSQEIIDQCISCGRIIGKELYAQGYRGILGIDAMILNSGELIPIVEINGRFTLSTYVSFIQDMLGLKGAKIFASYRKTALDKDAHYKSLLDILKNEQLIYNKDTQRGVIIYTSETITESRVGNSGRLFTLVIGSDELDTESSYNKLLEIIN